MKIKIEELYLTSATFKKEMPVPQINPETYNFYGIDSNSGAEINLTIKGVGLFKKLKRKINIKSKMKK